MNLYLTTLLSWAGIVVAVGCTVWACNGLYKLVAHGWRLRRLWADEPVVFPREWVREHAGHRVRNVADVQRRMADPLGETE